jgi:hypothetical protein
MRGLRDADPRTIGRFRLVGVVGAGGMGQVFLGIAPDGRLAAVKQVLADDDGTFGARFAREVEASRRVSGAYTAAVLDADPTAVTPWLASVFVAGPSLLDAVTAHGPLPETALRRLAAGLAVALVEIHRVGLLHRDLKPGNVLLAEDGPRVIDFGIAQATTDPGRLTASGALIGSPGYMSPEQVEGAPLTPASDIFALGGVLAFAATGTPPFGHVTVPALLYRVLAANPDLGRVPPSLRPLVAACLAKDSARRPTPEQILQWIGPLEPAHDWLPAPVHRMVDERAAQARNLAGARDPEPVTEALPLPAPRARKSWWVTCGIGLVAACALAAALAFAPLGRGTSADEAAGLVTDLLPRTPPAGFLVYDNPATPEVDGAATDPRKVGHTASYFACDVQADPPTAAESGIVAVSNVVFEEGVETLPVRVRDHRTITVAYLDDTARTRIGQELRERIGDCRTRVPAAFTALRFSLTEIPAADETVGYTFELPPVRGLPETPPEIGSCEIARVDAVVVRACALISNSQDPSRPQDIALAGITRGMLEPVLQQARALQQ